MVKREKNRMNTQRDPPTRDARGAIRQGKWETHGVRDQRDHGEKYHWSSVIFLCGRGLLRKLADGGVHMG